MGASIRPVKPVVGAMQRVIIMGGCGSGKSTLARRLGERLGLTVVHLDVLTFDPGWIEVDKTVFQDRLAQALAGDGWVADGNYTSKDAEIRLARADALLWIDQPRWKRMWRVVARIARHYGRIRPDMAEGCPERLDWAFLLHAWRWDRDKRAPLLKRVLDARPDLPITVLQGDREIARYLRSVPNREADSLVSPRVERHHV